MVPKDSFFVALVWTLLFFGETENLEMMGDVGKSTEYYRIGKLLCFQNELSSLE